MISRKLTMSWIAIVCFVGLAVACGSDEGQNAMDAAKEATAAAQEAAGEAADAAKEAASDAAEATGDAAEAAGDAAGEAASEVTGAAAVTLCKELAAKASWVDAVDVCTRAHEAAPDDMAVEHALQQAQAAAKAGS